MNCYQMRMLLPSFEDDELSAEEREAVYLHLAACSLCRSALASIRTLHRQLSLLQTVSVNSEIVDSVLARIKRITDADARETDASASDIAASGLDESSQGEADGTRREDPAADRHLPRWAVSGET